MIGRLLLCLTACAACATAGAAGDDEADDSDASNAARLVAETRAGPVTATVSLEPAAPRLGDALTLTLAVAARAGVSVDMPAFGDALGRFAILDFAPSEAAGADGAVTLSQRYTLQAANSGRQRIPQLRVEFLDRRDDPNDDKVHELLTDEIVFDVASVLPAGEVGAELRGLRDPLAERPDSLLGVAWPWLAAGLVALALAAGGLVLWRRRRAERARLTAFDRAYARLDRLRRGGMPSADAVDGWYVELSDTVRRYIEERFALRAPELTTEEFLLEAGRGTTLTTGHRELLSAFLERCDRVKFARYSPGADESREALDVALRFLNESRLEDAALDQRPVGAVAAAEAAA